MRGPYAFKIGDEIHDPESFGSLVSLRGQSIYNPTMLYADAILAAERIAFDLVSEGETVMIEIIGRQGTGGRESCPAGLVDAWAESSSVVLVRSPRLKWGTRIKRREAVNV